MGLLSVYRENVQVCYISDTFSRATFFNFLLLIIIVICPYLIAYRTQGFWTKIDFVREQPIVDFKHQVLFVMELETDAYPVTSKTLVWTTLESLNKMLESKAFPSIASRQGDENMDGIYEYLDLQVAIPTEPNSTIKSFHIFLLFDYKLLTQATLQMETLGHTYFQSSSKWNRFNLFADLGLTYKSPLWNHARDERYNKPVISRASTWIGDYESAKILHEYSIRNVSTYLKNKYEFVEEDGHLQVDEVLFNIQIRYPEAGFECWASLWNTLKWAWIQYLAIFIVVFGAVKEFQHLAYDGNMFDVRKLIPWEMKNRNRNVISHSHNRTTNS